MPSLIKTKRTMLVFELEYKGKKYHAHFSHYAISRTEEFYDKPLAEIIQATEGQEELFYHAHVAGCNHMNEKPLQRKDIPFLIDANYAMVDHMLAVSLQAIEDEKKKLRTRAERMLSKK